VLSAGAPGGQSGADGGAPRRVRPEARWLPESQNEPHPSGDADALTFDACTREKLRTHLIMNSFRSIVWMAAGRGARG
jgi:hypothetical protein